MKKSYRVLGALVVTTVAAAAGIGIRAGTSSRTSAGTSAGTSSGDSAGNSQQRTPGEIRVQTDLVNILASVTKTDGEPVAGLTQDAFQLSEEGVPQKIERFEAETNRPLDLALMVDSSMSAFKDMKFETEAAAQFIQQVVRPGDTLSVFEFDETVTKLSPFSDDVPQLQNAVRRITPGSGTSIYDAIVLASRELSQRPLGRRRAIVLVTDAGETTSISKFDQTRRAAIASGTLLYSIVIRPVKNEGGRNTAGEHASDYDYGQHRRSVIHSR